MPCHLYCFLGPGRGTSVSVVSVCYLRLGSVLVSVAGLVPGHELAAAVVGGGVVCCSLAARDATRDTATVADLVHY